MTSSPSPPNRILMVNYHTDTNRTMARLLPRYGYEATAAGTLAAARQLLDGHSVRCAVMPKHGRRWRAG